MADNLDFSMQKVNKAIKWISILLFLILTTIFLVGAIIVGRSAGFGLHASIYFGVSLLFFLLAILLVRKV